MTLLGTRYTVQPYATTDKATGKTQYGAEVKTQYGTTVMDVPADDIDAFARALIQASTWCQYEQANEKAKRN